MKYLNYFENNRFSDNDYYQEIESDEWDEFEVIKMSDSTISKINKLSPFQFTSQGNGLYLNIPINLQSTSPFNYINLYEGEDEYFYAGIGKIDIGYDVECLFKCDQLEGLKVLLNKIYHEL